MTSIELDLLGVPGYMVGFRVPVVAMDLAGNKLFLILRADERLLGVPGVPVKGGFFRHQITC